MFEKRSSFSWLGRDGTQSHTHRGIHIADLDIRSSWTTNFVSFKITKVSVITIPSLLLFHNIDNLA